MERNSENARQSTKVKMPPHPLVNNPLQRAVRGHSCSGIKIELWSDPIDMALKLSVLARLLSSDQNFIDHRVEFFHFTRIHQVEVTYCFLAVHTCDVMFSLYFFS